MKLNYVKKSIFFVKIEKTNDFNFFFVAERGVGGDAEMSGKLPANPRKFAPNSVNNRPPGIDHTRGGKIRLFFSGLAGLGLFRNGK